MNTRNLPCPCGSGLKHKKCCMQKEIEAENAALKKEQEDKRARETYKPPEPHGEFSYRCRSAGVAAALLALGGLR